jgi:hypothetical protein
MEHVSISKTLEIGNGKEMIMKPKWNGKYYWCDHHGWGKHRTTSCHTEKSRQAINKYKKEKNEQKDKESTATNDSDNKEKAKEKQMLKLAKAFVAITEPAEDTDDEFN